MPRSVNEHTFTKLQIPARFALPKQPFLWRCNVHNVHKQKQPHTRKTSSEINLISQVDHGRLQHWHTPTFFHHPLGAEVPVTKTSFTMAFNHRCVVAKTCSLMLLYSRNMPRWTTPVSVAKQDCTTILQHTSSSSSYNPHWFCSWFETIN